jgi:alpha-beta hydrolase superfamily lysophospholipase
MPELKTVNGSDVNYRFWPAPNAKAVVLLVHGMGAHTDRWGFTAEYLAKHNYPSYAIALKGYGETKTIPGHIDSFSIYYEDLRTLYRLIQKENPGKKIFILGESLGGLISYVFAEREPELFSGILLISPAFKNGMKISVLNYLKVFSSLIYDRKKTITMPFTSKMCTRDEAYRKIMDADPRELRIASSGLLFNTLLAQLAAKKIVSSSTLPILFLLAGKDYLVDPKESKWEFNRLPVKDKELKEYPEMLHALSIDLDREKVFADIVSWLDKRL